MNERKTPTAELRQTPTNDMRDGFDKEAGWGDEEAKAKLVAEQARIQQHYKRLVQQRKDYEQSGGDLVDEVYQGHGELRGERTERAEHKDSLPASLVAARPADMGRPGRYGEFPVPADLRRGISAPEIGRRRP